MLHRILPAFLRGTLCAIGCGLAVIIAGTIIYCLAILKYLIPIKPWHAFFQRALNKMPTLWSDMNTAYMRLFNHLEITLTGTESLQPHQWYLMTSNHQSWTDVMLLYRVFSHRIPGLRFFMKSQLLWVPILGLACWLVGFPFMKRYSQTYLAKHPKAKGKDLITTQKMCARFKQGSPMTIISFAEGTRYTPQKAAHQKTPFRHLLKPKAGGLAYTLNAMGSQIDQFLNVTLVYPNGHSGFWDYLAGKLERVIIDVERIMIPDNLRGDYDNDQEYRARFQAWLNQLWAEKDQRIDLLEKSS